MTPIKQQIEVAAKEHVQDAYEVMMDEIGFDAEEHLETFSVGALWAMRWWAERFNKVTQPVTGNLSLAETIAVIKSRQPDYDELFAAAAEILGEEK